MLRAGQRHAATTLFEKGEKKKNLALRIHPSWEKSCLTTRESEARSFSVKGKGEAKKKKREQFLRDEEKSIVPPPRWGGEEELRTASSPPRGRDRKESAQAARRGIRKGGSGGERGEGDNRLGRGGPGVRLHGGAAQERWSYKEKTTGSALGKKEMDTRTRGERRSRGSPSLKAKGGSDPLRSEKKKREGLLPI